MGDDGVESAWDIITSKKRLIRLNKCTNNNTLSNYTRGHYVS